MRGLLIGSALEISGSTASAGGFYVPEIGGRAAGKAAAVVAAGDDPRAVIHAPAHVVRVGLAARLAQHVRGELDVNYTRRSMFQSLDIDFVHEYYLLQTPGAYLYDVHIANDWHDSWTVRLGVEAEPFERPIALRAGRVYDQSPIDDRHFRVLTPDSDKLGISVGARWAQTVGTHRLDFQLAVSHLILREREIAPTASGDSGSDGTILNKPAPSFFYGVTRAGISILTLAVAWRQ